MSNVIRLSEQDQQFIANSIRLGLEALKAYGGQDAIQKYVEEIESLMTIKDGLKFLRKLQNILELMEEELSEYIR